MPISAGRRVFHERIIRANDISDDDDNNDDDAAMMMANEREREREREQMRKMARWLRKVRHYRGKEGERRTNEMEGGR